MKDTNLVTLTDMGNIVNAFVEKCVLIILNSRLLTKQLEHHGQNGSFGICENNVNEISDIFQEECSVKSINTYIVEIFIKKHIHKFLIEKYKIQYSFNSCSHYSNSITQQLTSILRTVHSLSRSLPARAYTQTHKGKDDEIEYRIFSNKQNNSSFIHNEKVHCVHISNDDNSHMEMNITVEYLSKESIMRINTEHRFSGYSNKTISHINKRKCANREYCDIGNYVEICNYSLSDKCINENYFSYDNADKNKQMNISFHSDTNVEYRANSFTMKRISNANDTTSECSDNNDNVFELCLESDSDNSSSNIQSSTHSVNSVSSININNNVLSNDVYEKYSNLKSLITKEHSGKFNIYTLACIALSPL